MNLKWKVFALTMGMVFFSGLLISFRGHLVINNVESFHKEQFRTAQAQWASEKLLNIVQTLESASKGLDRSTVATLERFGVGYFVHAYSEDKDWKFAPRTLSEISKASIREQLKEVPFSKLDSDKRSWIVVGEHLLLVSPVKYIGAEKLKTGYAVYGIEKSGFGNWLQQRDVDSDLESSLSIFAKTNGKVQNFQSSKEPSSFVDKLLNFGSENLSVQKDGFEYSSSFHPGLQLWIAGRTKILNPTFWWGPLAKLFYLGFLALGLLGYLIFQKMLKLKDYRANSENSAFNGEEVTLLKAVVHRLKDDLNRLKTTVSELPEPILKMEIIENIDQTRRWLGETPSLRREVKNFGYLIDVVLNLKETQIEEEGIQLETHLEEGIQAHCSVEVVEDFLLRLVDNSIENLRNEKSKKIRVELVRKNGQGHMIYSDSRTKEFPDKKLDTQVMSMKNPLQNIHGLLTFGRLIFQNEIQWTGRPFSIQLFLSSNPAETKMPPLPNSQIIESQQTEDVEPFEINSDLDQGALAMLQPLEIQASDKVQLFEENGGAQESAADTAKSMQNLKIERADSLAVDGSSETPSLEFVESNSVEQISDAKEQLNKSEIENEQSHVDDVTPKNEKQNHQQSGLQASSKAVLIDNIIDDFQLNDFEFTDLENIPPVPELSEASEEAMAESSEESSSNGLKEIKAGSLRLKIREPKKGKTNVSHK